ncbi:MAG: hypothetical protein RLZ72_683 [Actinomycetota bacterium]
MSSAREGRARQSALTLIGALAASLAIVFVIVWITIRPANLDRAEIDWHQVVAETPSDVALADPSFSEGEGDWWSNRAELVGGDYPEWYIGLITPTTGFVAVEQFFGDLPPEALSELDDVAPTPVEVGGTMWTVFDRSAVENPGNRVVIYLLTDGTGGGTLMVSGSAPRDEIELAAERSVESLGGTP